ncbi:MAG: CoA transferase [Burkholderiaceae bacterium]
MSAPPNPIGNFLAGVRVLDLSQYIPGPLGSLMLADMGADVIKIEPPTGDPMQHLGPRSPQGTPLFYETLNAGKSVLRLDLKSAQGIDTLHELVHSADVLIEGFRPGVMTRLGIDYPALSKPNPRLIYCAISGYGAGGELTNKAGHDANYLAEAGVLDRNGGEQPCYFDPPIADEAGSLYAALAIVGALHGRHTTGVGCHIDIALADVIMPLQLLPIAAYGANGTVSSRGETYLNGGAAYYNVYATSDGHYIVVGAVEEKFWRTFCMAADRADWIARQHEPLPQRSLMRDLGRQISQWTLADCAQRFADDDCCFSPVLPMDQAMAAARVAERDLVRTSPDGHLQALFPARINGLAPASRAPLRNYVAREL